MLTTYDNKWNPFKNYLEWRTFDCVENNYDCESILARIAKTSDSLSDQENFEEKERAIDEFIKNDFLHIYKKVYSEEREQDTT